MFSCERFLQLSDFKNTLGQKAIRFKEALEEKEFMENLLHFLSVTPTDSRALDIICKEFSMIGIFIH
ncbi:hypothetical protein DP117_00425 [Brasilonema sp. UFV-L1]|nr:hypothetical protein [Brasilonema sp. UFV-L1]